MKHLDETIDFGTHTGSLAIFNPVVLEHRVDEGVDWWTMFDSVVPEVAEGLVAIVELSGGGPHRIRLTSGELTVDECDYARAVIETLGFRIDSGSVFVGCGESLPSEGMSPAFGDVDSEGGRLVELPPGEYSLGLYAIDWFDSPR